MTWETNKIASLDQQWHDLRDVSFQQVEQPTPANPDPASAALNETIVLALDDKDFAEDCRYLLSLTAEVPQNAQLVHLKLVKALGAAAMPEDLQDYDAMRAVLQKTTVGLWRDELRNIYEDSAKHERFLLHGHFAVASTVYARGETTMMAALLNGITNPNLVLELGASLGLVGKMLILQAQDNDYGYDRTIIRNKVPRRKGDEQRFDQALTERYEAVKYASQFSVDSMVGVDYQGDYENEDSVLRRWQIICSRYLKELTDQNLNDRFFALLNESPPELTMMTADAAELTPSELGGKAQVTMLPTMMYMQPPSVGRQILQAAEACTTDDGIVVVQDKIFMHPNGNYRVYDRWDWHYRTWVKRMSEPELGYQPYFRADGGRNRELVIEDGAHQAPMAAELGLSG